MKSLRYPLLFVWMGITLTATAQKESSPPEEGTTRFYQYAAATSGINGKEVLFISNLTHTDFYTENLPIPDSVVNREMERQYIERLQRDYGAGAAFTFLTFMLQPNEEAVKKSYDSLLAAHKKKGYKIEKVKNFIYD